MEQAMNYAQSVAFVENAGLFGAVKNGLDNIRELLRRMGNPQDTFLSIHVAGTNGKGSVCAALDAILRQTGRKIGLFTSPYLERFTERIRIDGEEIAPETFARWANRVRTVCQEMVADGFSNPTFFELVTAICFGVFSEARVDAAVIEVGMGGRLDATNVLSPAMTVIANIGLDHTHVLGDTVEAIAREKAGIMKRGVPVVVYPQTFDTAYAQLLHCAREAGAPLYALRDAAITVEESGLAGSRYTLRYQGLDFGVLHVPLLGRMQVLNSATAVLAAALLAQQGSIPLTLEQIRAGLEAVRWPGRMELLSREPMLLLDGAHNPQGARQLAQTVRDFFPNGNAVLVTGMLRTKDAHHAAQALAGCAETILVTAPDSPKVLPPADLAACYRDAGAAVQVMEDYRAALDTALQLGCAQGRPVIVTGSLYLVGAARTYLLSKDGPLASSEAKG